jgi:hypothetical protein
MGWLVSRQSKEQLINELKADNPTITEWSLTGNHLWGLYPAHEDIEMGNNLMITKGEFIIHLFLLRGFGDSEWGYNVYSESAHPYHYTCPLKFLKKAPELCSEWRLKVEQYHADRAKRRNPKFNVGDVIPLKNSTVKIVEIVSVKPLKGLDQSTGIIYKIPPRFLAV